LAAPADVVRAKAAAGIALSYSPLTSTVTIRAVMAKDLSRPVEGTAVSRADAAQEIAAYLAGLGGLASATDAVSDALARASHGLERPHRW
jgi:hypothetical protein